MQTQSDRRKAPRRTYSTEFKMRMIEQALLPGFPSQLSPVRMGSTILFSSNGSVSGMHKAA